ncbi:MAG: hypothetical protein QOE65_1619 [Solirubrobacteraceae bacterium]|jgi:hypothetical protein|nr:hypothetical protein [Solirubrobacteraceae bacterium]
MLRRVALLTTLAALAAAAPAHANGDPPSDVLPFEDLYLPALTPSQKAADGLRKTVDRARAAGYPLKVAVIQAEVDLGPLAAAFTKPQQYADYLVTELPRHTANTVGARILVVTPSGAGIAGVPFSPGERRAARTIRVSTGATSDQVVTATQDTIQRMAKAAGKPIGSGKGAGGSGGGAVAAVLIGALVLAAALAGLAARRRASRGDAAT